MDFVGCLLFFWVTWAKAHWWSHLHPTGDCTRFVLRMLHTGDLKRATSSAGEMLTHTNRPHEISGGTKSCNRDAHTQNSLIIITKPMATEESTHTTVTQAVCQTHMRQDDKGSYMVYLFVSPSLSVSTQYCVQSMWCLEIIRKSLMAAALKFTGQPVYAAGAVNLQQSSLGIISLLIILIQRRINVSK